MHSIRLVFMHGGGLWCGEMVGMTSSKVLTYLMKMLHPRKFQGHFKWLVLTQSCGDFLITSPVCLWIYSLDQIISMCPQQGWVFYSAFLLVFFRVTFSSKMETNDLAAQYMRKSQKACRNYC